MVENPERSVRLEKLRRLKELGHHPYPARFEKKQELKDVLALKVGDPVVSAGRLITFREMGKITFAHLQDFSGRVQVIFKKDVLGDDTYKAIIKNIDIGDFIGVDGEVFVTKTGETSILIKQWTFLGKALLPLPEKFHGVQDKETLYRQRYLDLVSNPETRKRFAFRSNFIRALREFYWAEGFHEVETATLMLKATGAAARPYFTHNNALDLDVVLRISHELPLKELVVGGYEKVFELGKAFRNEGHDPSHLPEHLHLEHYAAFWNYEDNIRFTERMFDYLFDRLSIPRTLMIRGKDGTEREVNFQTPWKRVNFIELLNGDAGFDVMKFTDAHELRRELKQRKIEFEGMDGMSLTSLVDNLYKKVSRPKIVHPTILYHYPKFLQPLARVNDGDSGIVDQFQVVVNGWEVVKAYSELVDPIDQRARFEEQSEAKEAGDEEAYEVDEEYLTAMEHGMPPISGWGMGVERMLSLLTGQDNLRDVVLFPLIRPAVGESRPDDAKSGEATSD